MADLAKTLIGVGLLLVVVGAMLMIATRFGLPLGRLPGDLAFRGKNVRVYFPLATSILVSLVASIILYLVSKLPR